MSVRGFQFDEAREVGGKNRALISAIKPIISAKSVLFIGTIFKLLYYQNPLGFQNEVVN